MSRPHEFLVQALRSLDAEALDDVLKRAALALEWRGYDEEGNPLDPCSHPDVWCENRDACPNDGWCLKPASLVLATLYSYKAVGINCREVAFNWRGHAPVSGELFCGAAPTLGEAIDQAEAAAVAAGWRLPWRA